MNGAQEPAPAQDTVPAADRLRGVDLAHPEALGPALRTALEAAADGFDPVRFRFIEALARRASRQRRAVRRALEDKARRALAEYLSDYFSARERAWALVSAAADRPRADAEALRRLHAAGDFRGVTGLAARAEAAAAQDLLAALVRRLQRRDTTAAATVQASFEDELRRGEAEVLRAVAGAGCAAAGDAAPTAGQEGYPELSAVRRVRESLSRRRAQHRVGRILRDGPENPGPLNAQSLIIRSLETMRTLSPSYAERFVAYMDTLLWLERSAAALPAKAKAPGRREGRGKKPAAAK